MKTLPTALNFQKLILLCEEEEASSGKYAKLLDYHQKTEFHRDMDKMLHHNRNCKKTEPVTLE